eukprot:scaffold2053_cov342-Prasinococcus_capsulatus_cf.AAC.1
MYDGACRVAAAAHRGPDVLICWTYLFVPLMAARAQQQGATSSAAAAAVAPLRHHQACADHPAADGTPRKAPRGTARRPRDARRADSSEGEQRPCGLVVGSTAARLGSPPEGASGAGATHMCILSTHMCAT